VAERGGDPPSKLLFRRGFGSSRHPIGGLLDGFRPKFGLIACVDRTIAPGETHQAA
jgi:hypothetical protein